MVVFHILRYQILGFTKIDIFRNRSPVPIPAALVAAIGIGLLLAEIQWGQHPWRLPTYKTGRK